MHRVLKLNGRLALLVWRAVGAGSQPKQWAEVEAIRRHVSFAEAEKRRFLAPFYDGTEDDLLRLLSEAGFKDIEVHNAAHVRRLGPPEEFVVEEDYQYLDPEARAAVVADIRKAMEPYRTARGTAVPYGFHLAFGTKQ